MDFQSPYEIPQSLHRQRDHPHLTQHLTNLRPESDRSWYAGLFYFFAFFLTESLSLRPEKGH